MPTAIPYVYELDAELKVINKHFLASEEELKIAIDTVKNQGKAK